VRRDASLEPTGHRAPPPAASESGSLFVGLTALKLRARRDRARAAGAGSAKGRSGLRRGRSCQVSSRRREDDVDGGRRVEDRRAARGGRRHRDSIEDDDVEDDCGCTPAGRNSDDHLVLWKSSQSSLTVILCCEIDSDRQGVSRTSEPAGQSSPIAPGTGYYAAGLGCLCFVLLRLKMGVLSVKSASFHSLFFCALQPSPTNRGASGLSATRSARAPGRLVG
jgi:hypothetical protein